MPHYVLKIRGKKKTRYMIWSTIVDAPIHYDMSREDVEEYWRERYGSTGMRRFDEIMAEVERTGSSIGEAPKEIMKGNRAGPKEKALSYDRIVAHCVDGTSIEASLSA